MMRLSACITAMLCAFSITAWAQYEKEPDTYYPPDEEVQASLGLFLSMRKLGSFEGTYKTEEIEAQRAALAKDPDYTAGFSADYMKSFRAGADYWVRQSDETIRSMIPGENPRMLVPSYGKGCPLHLGGVSTMQPIWGKPNCFRCTVGGEEWGPGMQVKNPGTGEMGTITDDGYGWKCPEGFPNPDTYYFVAAYRLSLLKMLFSRPYRDFVDFEGYTYARPAIWCTAYTYALTQDPRYAHKVLVMLTGLADIYRNCNSLHNWRNYPARAYITDHNFECNIIRQCLDAYDFTFDAIKDDRELLEWFKQSRDKPDINADGAVDHRDIKYHLERNLFAYMYEFLHRAIPIGRGNSRTWQLGEMVEMAVGFRHDAVLQDALDSRFGLRQVFTNCFYRDGRFYEDSTGYSTGVNSAYLRIGDYLRKFRGRETFPNGLNPDDVFGERYANIRTFTQRAASAGRLPGWGDSGNARTPVFRPTPEPQQSVLFGDIGYSIMRSSGPSEQQLHLLLYFAQSGAGHGHHDQLMLKPIRWGYDFSADLGYPYNLSAPKRAEWYDTSTTHCTVNVDSMNQRTGCTGTLDLYADADWVQLTAASSNNAYEATELYHRTAAIVSMGDDAHYIVDIFRVKGGRRRDYIYHSLSGDEGSHFQQGGQTTQPLEKVMGTLAGPDVEWMADTGKTYGDSVDNQPGRRNGYSYIRSLWKTPVDADWWCQWSTGDERNTGLKMWMAGAKGRQLYLGKGEGHGAPGASPWDAYIIARDDAAATGSDESIFCAVFEPFRNELHVKEVTWLQPKPASETRGMPVAAKVTTAEGVFVVFSSMDGEAEYEFTDGAEDYGFQGRFYALRIVEGGDIESVVVDSAIDPPLTGTVTALDFATPAVTVTASAPLPVGEDLAGQPIMFNDPSWPKNSVFTIGEITPVEDGKEYVIALDGPGFEAAAGTIDEVNADEGWVFTKDSLEKMFNCHYLYDGKALCTADKSQWFQIDTARTGYYSVGDVTIRFKDKAAAKAFKAGDRFWIMDVNPGATFKINCVSAAFG